MAKVMTQKEAIENLVKLVKEGNKPRFKMMATILMCEVRSMPESLANKIKEFGVIVPKTIKITGVKKVEAEPEAEPEKDEAEEEVEEAAEEAPIAKVINLQERKKCRKNVSIAKNSPISKNYANTALNTTGTTHEGFKKGSRENSRAGILSQIGTRKEIKAKTTVRGVEIRAYRPYAAVG